MARVAIVISILRRSKGGVPAPRWNAVLTEKRESSISVPPEILDFAARN
jgi:hypothetical protein